MEPTFNKSYQLAYLMNYFVKINNYGKVCQEEKPLRPDFSPAF